jgi:hypothetical protein
LDKYQKGHWYTCKNPSCRLRIPLPDRIFIETDYTASFEAECACGYMNYFSWSDSEDETNKLEVDRSFAIRGSKLKWVSYWEE